jgi:hypothetical protein
VEHAPHDDLSAATATGRSEQLDPFLSPVPSAF